MTLETALARITELEIALAEAATASAVERQQLRRRIQELEQQLARRKAAVAASIPSDGTLPLFADPDAPMIPAPASVSPSRRGKRHAPAPPRGRRPLDPALPRDVIPLPDPPESQRVDPFTGQRFVPRFTETLEVLACTRPRFFVKQYVRTVWGSVDKDALVVTPWPANTLPRSQMDVSVVAHIGAEHFCEHVPYYRLEQKLARLGVALPRSTQVSLMAQLNDLVAPVVEAAKHAILASGYVHLDATPIDLCDPARPGETRSSTVWAYRARAPGTPTHGLVWFDFRLTKSPTEPSAIVRAAKYRGIIQTDGAAGLDALAPPDKITHLGCWAHGFRYFVDALATDARARPYVALIDRLFRIDARARAIEARLCANDPRRHRLATWRTRFSVPAMEALFTRATTEIVMLPPKTLLAIALGYVLGQRDALRRAVTTLGSSLDNNPVENAIRPLKIGARNWLFVGHPDAGPRLANLFTLIENCRQTGVDAESYLVALMTDLASPSPRPAAEWLPQAWKQRCADGIAA